MAAVGATRDNNDDMRRYREYGTAVSESSTIVVDAAPVMFTVWGTPDRWWAAGHHDGFGLVLECQRVSTSRIKLVRVHDLDT